MDGCYICTGATQNRKKIVKYNENTKYYPFYGPSQILLVRISLNDNFDANIQLTLHIKIKPLVNVIYF